MSIKRSHRWVWESVKIVGEAQVATGKIYLGNYFGDKYLFASNLVLFLQIYSEILIIIICFQRGRFDALLL